MRDLLAPLATRIGTAISGYLIGHFAADPSLANEVATGLAALALIGADLVFSAIGRHNRTSQIVPPTDSGGAQ